jgi:hypothetical protein
MIPGEQAPMYGRLAVLQSTLLLKDPVMQLTRLQLPMTAEWLQHRSAFLDPKKTRLILSFRGKLYTANHRRGITLTGIFAEP